MKQTSLNREFRKVKSLNYLYEVNGDGTIFRNVKSKKQSKIKLDYHHSKAGYYTVFVHIGGRRPGAYTKRVMIHRVVAECWLGDCPEGIEVDHINRDSHDNRYTNLRYVTKSEQMKNRDHTNIGRRGAQNLADARSQRMVGVTLTKDGVVRYFDHLNGCALWFAEMYGVKFNSVRYKLTCRRKNIMGFDVQYRNAETKHDCSTEQEIVHIA